MAQILAILEVLKTVVGLAKSALAAFETNDQATLDALHAQAVAAADALKPTS